MRISFVLIVVFLTAQSAWAQTRYYSISASSMVAITSNTAGAYTDTDYTGPTSGGFRTPIVTPTTPLDRETLQANVKLPQGATISSLTCAFFDGSTTSRLAGQVLRYSTGGGSSRLANVATSFAATGNVNLTTHSILYPLVDNTRYAYALDVWVTGNCANCRVFNCKIGFLP